MVEHVVRRAAEARTRGRRARGDRRRTHRRRRQPFRRHRGDDSRDARKPVAIGSRKSPLSSKATCIVNVQGDEPMISPEAIDIAVGLLLERPDDLISTLRRRIDDPADLENPSVVKVVTDREGYALYFSRQPMPFVRPGQPRSRLLAASGPVRVSAPGAGRLSRPAPDSARAGGRTGTVAGPRTRLPHSHRRDDGRCHRRGYSGGSGTGAAACRDRRSSLKRHHGAL